MNKFKMIIAPSIAMSSIGSLILPVSYLKFDSSHTQVESDIKYNVKPLKRNKKYIFQEFLTKYSLGHYFLKSKSGALYFPSNSPGGLAKFNPDATGDPISLYDNINYVYYSSSWGREMSDANHKPGSDFKFCMLKDGRIFGVDIAGIRRFYEDQNKMLNINRDSVFLDVWSPFLFQDQQTNIVYYGVGSHGIQILNPDDNSISNFVNNIDVSNGFMYQTKDGTVYVGTKSQGLKKINKTTNTLEDVLDTNVDGGFMYQTKSGNIYLGTKTGLMKFNPNDNSLKTISDLNIRGFIFETSDNRIFVGSSYHLLLLNEDEESVEVVNNANTGSGSMFELNNKIYFASSYGVAELINSPSYNFNLSTNSNTNTNTNNNVDVNNSNVVNNKDNGALIALSIVSGILGLTTIAVITLILMKKILI